VAPRSSQVGPAKNGVDVQIGEQKARVINNIENNFADERLHGALQELLAVVGTAVAEGALDERRAMALESAAGEVGRAVAEEGKGSSRLRRAIENL
jgi:hypothetical protein